MAKKATNAKTKELIRVKVSVRHDFTTEEWKQKTDELTRTMKGVELKEEAVKAATASAKAEIKQLKSDVNDLANQLRNGYEMQQVEASVEFNRRKGEKKLYHHCPGKPDHNKLIRVEAMTEEDYQSLPMPEPEPEAAPERPEVHAGPPTEEVETE